MLHIENIFLPLNFNPQLFFSGQVSQILRHEQMVVIMQDRVSRDVLAGFATQQNANRGIVALFAFEFVVHPNIHIYLTDILMGDRAHFQINQNIAFQFDVIEHKVDVVIFRVGHNVLLSGHESKSLSHFHEEVPDVRKNWQTPNRTLQRNPRCESLKILPRWDF